MIPDIFHPEGWDPEDTQSRFGMWVSHSRICSGPEICVTTNRKPRSAFDNAPRLQHHDLKGGPDATK